MISQADRIRRVAPADGVLIDVIRQVLADNVERIPLTTEGGFIATDISETGSDEDLHIAVYGYMGMPGQMVQDITVIWFDTREKADRFRSSPEGQGFDDPYGEGQDCFDYTTYAGDPRLPERLATILRNYFGIREDSNVVMETYCEVDYFRKDSNEAPPKPLKS